MSREKSPGGHYRKEAAGVNGLSKALTTFSGNTLDAASISGERISVVRNVIAQIENQNIRALGVFGSVAGGTATDESDLDYFIVKQAGITGLHHSYEDIELLRLIHTLPFRCHLTGALALSEMDSKRSNPTKTTMKQLFSMPLMLKQTGINPLVPNNLDQPFVTKCIIVGRSAQEEREIICKMIGIGNM